MVIYLDDYRKVNASRAVAQERRKEERMLVNRGPGIAIAASFSYQRPHEVSSQLPDDLESIDLDAFMERAYALASQI